MLIAVSGAAERQCYETTASSVHHVVYGPGWPYGSFQWTEGLESDLMTTQNAHKCIVRDLCSFECIRW